MELQNEEIQILLTCIYACKFEGRDVVSVGLLTKKLIDKLAEYDSNKKTKVK